MDVNFVKIENDYPTMTEVYIKTEPLDNSSEFLTEATAFTEGHQHDIKTELFELNIKSENRDVKEVLSDPLYVDNHIGDQSVSKNMNIKEERSIELTKEEYRLNNDEKKLHESGECGEFGRQNHSFVQEKPIRPSRKKFKCIECDKLFSYKRDLKRHFLIHFGVKPYKCDICEKLFSQKTHLNAHTLIHTGEKPFKCEICNKTFSQLSHLRAHKSIHSEDKPHACDQCDQRFKLKHSLISHKRTHSGEKPYKCDLCGIAFAQTSTLTTHRRTHTGERPYPCDICNKSFSQKTYVNKHKLRKHNT